MKPNIFTNDAITKGHISETYDFVNIGDKEPTKNDVFFCDIKQASAIQKEINPIGLFFSPEKFQFHKILEAVHVGGMQSHFLNNIPLFSTWGTLKRASKKEKLSFPMFIRPNDATKVFTGFSCKTAGELKTEINSRNSVPNETLCVLAPVQELHDVELRVWVDTRDDVEYRIISHSRYSWNDIDYSHEPEWIESALKLAEKFASNDYMKIDDLMVLDFCYNMENKKPMLIECNPYSTSGWYEEAGPDKIIDRAIEVVENY